MKTIEIYRFYIGCYFKVARPLEKCFHAKLESIDETEGDGVCCLKTDLGGYVNVDVEYLQPMIKTFQDLDLNDVKNIVELCQIPIPYKSLFPKNSQYRFVGKTDDLIEVAIHEVDDQEMNLSPLRVNITSGWLIKFKMPGAESFFVPENIGRVMLEMCSKGYDVGNNFKK